MTAVEMSWGSLLKEIDRIGRKLPFIFFATCPATEVEPCLVVDDDEFESDEDIPEAARRRGFTSGLLVNDVQQVLENLRQQNPAASHDQVMHAVAFYFERDAFIDLSN